MSNQRFPHAPLFAVSRWDLSKVVLVLAALFGLMLLHNRGGTTTGADINTDRLTSRSRAAAPAVTPLAVGEALRTGPGQRRRVGLPGGSVLLVDQNSEVKLETPTRLCQEAGEIFVEAGPRLEVKTPRRVVSAAEAGVGVRVEAQGTRVLVTRGQAEVQGLTLRAGKQLAADGDEATTAPRASHVLAWTRDLRIAAESPLVPGSQYAGGTLIARDPNGQEAKLSLRKFHIDVHIEDGFARTTIDQTYFNDAPWQLEGTFYFPLPPDASLSRLAMYVDGNLMEGGMAERDYARQVYETIRYTQRDPALLEWVDGSTFKMRVFPLEPRQEKRLILSYTQKLPSLYGQTTYRFPAGHTLQTVRDLSFHVRIKDAAALPWESYSHALQATKDGNDLVLATAVKNAPLDRDLVVSVRDRDQAEETVRFSAADHDQARYLMLRYRPQLAAPPVPAGPRHWVFLFESSGDRDPLLARVQIDLIHELLLHADAQDTFMVLSAGTRVRTLSKDPQPATPANIQAAVTFLENTHLVGALDLGRALTEAAAALRKGANPYLVHVGSGIAAMGERRDDVLAKRLLAGARYVGVGVGRRWARNFMKATAERTGGHFTQVNPDEPIAWRAFDLFATLATPRLLNAQVVEPAGKAVFLSLAQSVAQGEELCAITRLDTKGRAGAVNPLMPATVAIRGTLEGQAFERILPVKDVAERADYLPRTWAKLEIDRLLAADAVKHKDQVIALSKAMYVMTPFTSLLVLENEDLYTQYKVDRGRQDHWAMYPCPKKIPVVVEPDPNLPGAGKSPKTAKQVLDTIVVRTAPRILARSNGSGNNAQMPVSDSNIATRGATQGIQEQVAELLRPMGETMPGKINFNTFSPNGFVAGLTPAGTLTSDLSIPISKSDLISARPSSFLVGGEMAQSNQDMQTALARWSATKRRKTAHFIQNLDEDASSSLEMPPIIPARPAPPTVNDPSPAGTAMRRDSSPYLNLLRDGMSPALNYYNLVTPGTGSDPHWSNWVMGLQITTPLGYRPEPRQAEADLASSNLFENRQSSKPTLLLYQRPSYSDDARLFSDLIAYAPGMNTSLADIEAVLEAEAIPSPHNKPGQIDAGARKLFAQARVSGWQSLRILDTKDQPGLTIHFDADGRYAYEHVLPLGLKERVVCDGKTLLHLYPELGVGARRTLSRFHRIEFWEAVPWALPPVEDLARGADLKVVGDRTVAVVPHYEALLWKAVKRVQEKKGARKVSWVRHHLVFGGDGRLAERQVVSMPKQEVLYRETITANGSVRVFDGKGKEPKLRLECLLDGTAPDLAPDTKNLLVLSLPYRTANHVKQTLKIEKTANQNLRFKDALPPFAAEMAAGNTNQALAIFTQVYHARDQRQLGFYVLLAACGANLDGQNVDVLAEHVDEPLAQYLALHSSPVLRKHASQWAAGSGQWGQGMLHHLGISHALYQRWQSDRVLKLSTAKRQLERQRALDYVQRNKGSVFGWVLLTLLQDRAGKDKEFHRALVDSWRLFEDVPGLSYAARYEQARSLWKSGQQAAARQRFRALYETALKDGVLPAIDADFRLALLGDGADDPWSDLLRRTAAQLIEQKRRPAVLALAWQCWQLEDQPLANHLLATALDKIGDEKERTAMTLAGVGFLARTAQLPQADRMLRGLLADPKLAKHASLWRLGAKLAERRELSDRELECLEHALDAEFRKLPAVIDLNQVRTDYAKLLAHYQNLADAMVTLKIQPPSSFTARVVRAGDRWRALDSDGTSACQAVARILQKLGERDLGWDYLTTPIALHPNEASPWLELGGTLSRKGDLDLADRAFAAAFASEPTNAQILWDRAENLRHAARHVEARELFRQIAEGRWQPRFQGLQTQARLQLR